MNTFHTIKITFTGLIAVAASCISALVSAQIAPLPLPKAIQTTELPLGAWGTYSRTHLGPCYLGNRFPMELFSFPLVVGQVRYETVIDRPVAAATQTRPGARTRLEIHPMALRRRSMGTSPVSADADDAVYNPETPTSALNRHVRVQSADADGYLWSESIHFEKARPVQRLVRLTDAAGLPVKPADWGEGEADIACFPAFADPDADGLLVRVKLHNSSNATEMWYVDQAGGIDTITQLFMPADLSIDARPDAIILHHAHNTQTYAIAVNAPAAVSTAAVGDSYFSAPGSASPATGNEDGPISGLLDAASLQDPKIGRWGLLRMNRIVLEPGANIVVWIGIGIGKDADSAVASVHTLLHLAQDAPGDSKVARIGAYSQAVAADKKARYTVGDPIMDRLMAQSLLNVPCNGSRRLGVASRNLAASNAMYHPTLGAYDALGWIGYRPDWSASQLNAWFSTLSNPETPLRTSHAMPSPDLFVLWQLYEASGSETLLKYVYPFARHRYQELLAGCKLADGSALYTWPIIQPDGLALLAADPVADPDAGARIAASARILGRMAEILQRPAAEITAYEEQRKKVIGALNIDLWNPGRGMYIARLASSLKPGAAPVYAEADLVTGLLPIMAGPGAISDDRLQALIKRLKDPKDFWSPYGVRLESMLSAGYKHGEHDRIHGGIDFGTNWLLWQALMDLGRAQDAHELATNLVDGYRAAAAKMEGFPQWIDADTGIGMGAADWTGDSGCILWLYAAYHVRGTVTSGIDIAIQDHHYEEASDSLKIVYKSGTEMPHGVIQCVMGRSNTEYMVSGDATATIKTDANGLLMVPAPQKSGTQQILVASKQKVTVTVPVPASVSVSVSVPIALAGVSNGGK